MVDEDALAPGMLLILSFETEKSGRCSVEVEVVEGWIVLPFPGISSTSGRRVSVDTHFIMIGFSSL
jgi:hypothetical protein